MKPQSDQEIITELRKENKELKDRLFEVGRSKADIVKDVQKILGIKDMPYLHKLSYSELDYP